MATRVGLNRYLTVIAPSEVRAPVAWSVLGRLPLVMISLGLALFVLERASYQQAGTVVGVFTAGVAIVGLPVGRLLDRRGQAGVLLVTGILFPLALVAFVAGYPRSQPWDLTLVFAAGASRPPINSAVRALWGSVLATPEGRSTAFALEAIFTEVFTIGGPLLLSLGTLFVSTGTALITGGAVVGAGTIGLALTKACRTWDGGRSATAVPTRWGPLGSPPFLLLLGCLGPAAMAVGMVSMAIPSFADARHSSGIAGILFAAWGVGSVVGGVWFGRSDSAQPAGARFATLLWLFGAGTALPILAWDPWSLGAALAIGGMVIAPLTALEYALVHEFVPPGALAEGFSWVASLNVLASAVGSQLAGVLMEHGSLRSVFATAAAGGLAAGVPARRLRRRSTAAT